MFKYFVKRLISIFPKLLIISMLVFLGMEMIPGEPLARMIDRETMSHMTKEQMEVVRHAKGLDAPASFRYLRWLGSIMRGDFGYSTFTGTPIRSILAERFPATLELCVLALIIANVLGLVFGCFSARFKNTIIDYFNTVIGLVGVSVPNFFFAMSFILLFGVSLKWLPTGGRMTVGHIGLLNRLQHMIMPSTCMAIGLIAYLMRLTRNSMLDVMNKDYVKTARAKGEKEWGIFLKHVFRNGCTPVVLLLIGRLGMLVSGSMVIETVFNYPGMGMLIVNSITSKDLSVAMMTTFISAVMVLFTSLLGDVAIALLDPRVHYGKKV